VNIYFYDYNKYLGFASEDPAQQKLVIKNEKSRTRIINHLQSMNHEVKIEINTNPSIENGSLTVDDEEERKKCHLSPIRNFWTQKEQSNFNDYMRETMIKPFTFTNSGS